MGLDIVRIDKALKIKTFTIGLQIGGALGALSGIPGGEIIGSIADRLLGDVLKKAKKGYASDIGLNSDGRASYAIAGNSAFRKVAAGGAAESLATALDRIAEQLMVGSLPASSSAESARPIRSTPSMRNQVTRPGAKSSRRWKRQSARRWSMPSTRASSPAFARARRRCARPLTISIRSRKTLSPSQRIKKTEALEGPARRRLG